MVKNTTFGIADAAKYSGMTRNMIYYLGRAGVFKPSGSKVSGKGRPKIFTFGDVVILRVIDKLLKSGVSVKRLKKALIALRKYHAEITPRTLPGKYLLTDGTTIYFRKEGESLEVLDNNRQLAFTFVLELQSLRDGVLIATGQKRSA